MPRTRDGELITWKEFFRRWKLGIEGISPLQQVKTQCNSTLIMIVGIICGIIVSIAKLGTLWWLMIVLVGALFNSLIQYAGFYQKKMLLQRIEKEVFNNE